jgi:CubicO group peptidase (beta-lactamase class C family)
MQTRRIPGAAIAVVERGKIILKRAYGIANLEADTPVKTSSIFELASVTKQFTATAIMMLVEEGKVRLDEPISTYIDRTPEAWRNITVRHLLTHTAGLGGAVVTHEGSPLLDAGTKQQFDFIARAPLLFPPGEKGQYSDAGYVLLGMIIERASGQSYREFMQKRIFDPLQMTDTSILDKWRIIKHRVPTYRIRAGKLAHWRRDWQYEMPSFFGIFSTVEDLAKWAAALQSGTLLKQSSFDEMWTPAKLNNGLDALVGGDLYGFGWRLGDVRGHRIAEHSGASGTHLLRFLEDGFTIIVLTNLDGPSGSRAATLARGIAALVKPEYQLPQMLTPQPDPTPQTTQAIRALLSDVAEGHDSPMMTQAHRAFYNSFSPSYRQQLSQQVKPLKSLTYIASDDVEGRGVRITEPITRINYYKGELEGKPYYFTFWLTKDGKVAHLRFSQE